MKRLILIIIIISISLTLIAQRHLPTCHYRIDYTNFIVDWDSIHKVPRFVYYIIYADSLKDLPRTKFKEDRRIKSTSRMRDYFRSGYDKGHLLPHKSAWSKAMRNDCFFMTNMAPQMPGLNRGLWKSIENEEREMARPYAYVITGTDVRDSRLRLNGYVIIPTAFWKIIYNPVRDILKVYYTEQHDRGTPEDFRVDLDWLEWRIGIDFDF